MISWVYCCSDQGENKMKSSLLSKLLARLGQLFSQGVDRSGWRDHQAGIINGQAGWKNIDHLDGFDGMIFLCIAYRLNNTVFTFVYHIVFWQRVRTEQGKGNGSDAVVEDKAALKGRTDHAAVTCRRQGQDHNKQEGRLPQ